MVVIDDIWDSKAWGIIKLALLDNNFGSRIITTTRSFTVASCSSSQSGHIYDMEPLGFDDSKRLFVKRAFGSEDFSYPHLQDVLNEILGKCSGLPLAIITIASMLTDQKARSEWERVANSIGSALAKDPDAERMMNILSLSYVDVPQHVRTCLLYLSVFPEDYQIKKKCLINRWIAEGFIHEEQGMSRYEIGERYFNDLINRSLIQPIDVKFGQAKACRVHDIILDYLKYKAAEENFVVSLDVGDNGCTSESKVRRLSLYKSSTENITLSTSLILSHIRSLTIFGYSNIASSLPFSHGTSLLPFTALRVLDLYDCQLIGNPHILHIEKLFLLKYLRLGKLHYLPDEVGELQYLETLDLQRSIRTCLPPSIGKLQRLAHLYVGWQTSFPNGLIGQMRSLEELNSYDVLSYKQGEYLQEFSKLTKLKSLKIRMRFGLPPDKERTNQVERYHSYVGSLLSSCNLHSLYIINKSVRSYPLLMDPWHPTTSCSLRRLHLKGCDTFKVPDWMGSLGNLEVLEMSILCISSQDMKILGAIPSLHFLKLRTVGGTNGRIIIRGSHGFRSLKQFSLAMGLCGTALEFEAGSMPKLELLHLWFCLHKMECVNYASDFGIQHLSALISMVKVSIGGDYYRDTKYNPAEDMDDSTIRRVASVIKTAIDMHPSRPILRFDIWHDNDCESFESVSTLRTAGFGNLITLLFVYICSLLLRRCTTPLG